MAFDNSSPPHPTTGPASTTNILVTTLAVIIGVAVLGAIFGAVWPLGLGLVTLLALVALFFILTHGAAAMNEPGSFGQGLTAVIAAVFLLPGAIGAAVFLGAAFRVSDALDDFSPGTSSYEDCMVDPDTTYEECLELE
jgi:hypothetical protein